MADDDGDQARRLLDEAYAFDRGQDFTAAVSRARAAALSLGRFGPPTSMTAAHVSIAASRFAAHEQAFRHEVERRAERYRAREVAAANEDTRSAP